MSGVQVKTSRFETGIRGTYLIVAAIGGFLCVALALVPFRYLLRVGGAPPVIEGNLLIEPWLMVHVAGAATALLIGPWQFSSILRTRLPTLLRWIGRIYVVSCLVGGAAGFVLARPRRGSHVRPSVDASRASIILLLISRKARLPTKYSRLFPRSSISASLGLIGFSYRGSEILAAPIASRDFEERILNDLTVLRALVKEVTLGAHSTT